MRLLPILLSCVVSIATPSLSHADNIPVCKDSPFQLIDSTASFGISKNAALPLLKKAFGKVADIRVIGDSKNFILVTFHKNHKNLEAIIYLFNQDQLTRVMFTYHKDFVSNFGGTVEAFKAIDARLSEKHGQRDDVETDKDKDRVVLVWNKSSVSLRLIGQGDPEGVQIRIDCLELEQYLQKKAASNANFGF